MSTHLSLSSVHFAVHAALLFRLVLVMTLVSCLMVAFSSRQSGKALVLVTVVVIVSTSVVVVGLMTVVSEVV